MKFFAAGVAGVAGVVARIGAPCYVKGREIQRLPREGDFGRSFAFAL